MKTLIVILALVIMSCPAQACDNTEDCTLPSARVFLNVDLIKGTINGTTINEHTIDTLTDILGPPTSMEEKASMTVLDKEYKVLHYPNEGVTITVYKGTFERVAFTLINAPVPSRLEWCCNNDNHYSVFGLIHEQLKSVIPSILYSPSESLFKPSLTKRTKAKHLKTLFSKKKINVQGYPYNGKDNLTDSGKRYYDSTDRHAINFEKHRLKLTTNSTTKFLEGITLVKRITEAQRKAEEAAEKVAEAQRKAAEDAEKVAEAQRNKWVTWTGKSKLDDSPEVRISTAGDSEVSLKFRCHENKTVAYLLPTSGYHYFSDVTRTMLRFDSETAYPVKLYPSIDKKGLHFDRRAIPIIKKMMKHKKLYVRWSTRSKVYKSTFDLRKLKDEIVPLRKACNWT